MDRYMSIRRLVTIGTFLFLLSTNSVFAQDEGYFTISFEMLTDLNSISNPITTEVETKEEETPLFFTESADIELTPKGSFEEEEEIPSYYRHHKLLDSNFTGYVIELLQSDVKLERNYPLFERFGNVYIKELDNGKYSYCIIANFKKSSSLKIFVNEVIIPRAPEARALKYKKGKCKKM